MTKLPSELFTQEAIDMFVKFVNPVTPTTVYENTGLLVTQEELNLIVANSSIPPTPWYGSTPPPLPDTSDACTCDDDCTCSQPKTPQLDEVLTELYDIHMGKEGNRDYWLTLYREIKGDPGARPGFMK